MIIAFAGHSFIFQKDIIKDEVKKQIIKSIDRDGAVTCYLGGYGDFDDICALACKELKRTYNCIETVYVTPYLNLSAQAKIKEMKKHGLCDDSIYPLNDKTPLRFAISRRNEWMISCADLIIAYVNHDWGGAWKSVTLAKRKNKKIINIYEVLKDCPSNDKA